MTLAVFGVSFLTPLDGLFALAAAVPLAALVATERRSGRIRMANSDWPAVLRPWSVSAGYTSFPFNVSTPHS